VSPSAATAWLRQLAELDLSAILPTIATPTLVLHRRGDPLVPLESGRRLAQAIPRATFLELPGDDYLFWVGDVDPMLDAIRRFVTDAAYEADVDRVLATLLFTDIVGSTDLAERLGDRRWRDRLEDHHAMIRQELHRHRGTEIDTAGDGFFAVFDGPARAVRCALSAAERVQSLDLHIRAGVHTGEVEMHPGGATGVAVHIASRIAGLASTDEVVVSRTVKDLVAGSGLSFENHGTHRLKGVADEWEVFRARR
jgi:class 3 adenylate cyclase